MGLSLSTLGGWTFLSCIFGYYIYRGFAERSKRDAARAAAQRQRLEERQGQQNRKESKEKAKRQRGEAYSKDVDESAKAAQSKQRAPKASSNPTHTPDYSSDEGVDNREFARQLSSVKQGTNLSAPKKDEKRQKSVKQSRARAIEEPVEERKASAPSSTAGADADDDESPIASPEVTAADAAGVSDMLEPKSAGPSILRLTDTDKVKQKEKKAKALEKTETKKQRQNRQKAEAAKVAREEAEKQRQVALEAQRRLARISEGRAAKDGSAFMASQVAQSAWKGNGVNTSSNSSLANGDFVPVQPLDTFDTSSHTDVSVSKAVPAATGSNDGWLAVVPSEEEQIEAFRKEDEDQAWSTVTTKKPKKGAKKESATDNSASESGTVAQPRPIISKSHKANVNGNGKPAKPISQQSAFAALSTNDEPDVENEWDV